MDDSRQLRLMLLVSLIAHIVMIMGGFLYTFRSQARPMVFPSNAQVVELYEPAELPEIPEPQPELPVEQPEEEEQIALQDLEHIIQAPTPTPTPFFPPTPTPIPVLTPTPTPMPVLMPTPTVTPQLRATPTPRPRPTIAPTPTPRIELAEPDEDVLEIPRRRPVIIYRPADRELPIGSERASSTETGSRSSSASGQTSGSGGPMTFETEDAFPYPEYLEHIKEKIEGLWFPEGSGTVSIYLIIDRSGKILKSGVDKGTGVDVEKLRESIIRAIDLTKRFQPLPEEYTGMELKVRIIVRR